MWRVLQALGFHIWVAELELLLGQVKGSKANIDSVAGVPQQSICPHRLGPFYNSFMQISFLEQSKAKQNEERTASAAAGSHYHMSQERPEDLNLSCCQLSNDRATPVWSLQWPFHSLVDITDSLCSAGAAAEAAGYYEWQPEGACAGVSAKMRGRSDRGPAERDSPTGESAYIPNAVFWEHKTPDHLMSWPGCMTGLLFEALHAEEDVSAVSAIQDQCHLWEKALFLQKHLS